MRTLTFIPVQLINLPPLLFDTSDPASDKGAELVADTI